MRKSFLLGIAVTCIISLSHTGTAQTPAPAPVPAPPTYAIPPAPLSVGPTAIPTFECLGLYWSPAEGAEDNKCLVKYKAEGEKDWKEGMPLWFDARNKEYRGSLFYLKSGTSYEISLLLEKSKTAKTLTAKTWNDNFPIAKTVTLPAGKTSSTYTINEGGSANGYVLYVAPEGSEIDANNQADSCVTIQASYVIVRGLTLKNAQRHGIVLKDGVHDVVIERCDISGWGRVADDGFGKNLDSGVGADSSNIERIIIQRNKFHHPRANANDWTQERTLTKEKLLGHPNGAQAVTFYNPLGNNVIRYNDIYSDEDHRFNDGIGGNENFSHKGFPGPDSDIYGNSIRNICDDSIESEGGNRNVRIWGNYMEYTFTGVATASTSIGPVYVFRNIMTICRRTSPKHAQSTESAAKIPAVGVFGKLGDSKNGRDGLLYGKGLRCYYHNTIYQPQSPYNPTEKGGAGTGVADWGGVMTYTVSRNNIWEINNATKTSIGDGKRSPTNDFDYDLYNGKANLAEGNETHGIVGTAVYDKIKEYALAPTSPGYGKGTFIPNMNDSYSGKMPDIGAQESALPPLEFGVNAYIK